MKNTKRGSSGAMAMFQTSSIHRCTDNACGLNFTGELIEKNDWKNIFTNRSFERKKTKTRTQTEKQNLDIFYEVSFNPHLLEKATIFILK